MPQKVGSITLTHMLNRRGRIELETTIVRMAEDKYLPCLRGVLRAAPAGSSGRAIGRTRTVTVTALSGSWGALSLNGPKSRDVLATCTDARLDNAVLPMALGAADHRRRAQRLGLPHVLCGRVGLGIAHAFCRDGGCLCRAMARGRGAWDRGLRQLCDERDAYGEGLQRRGRVD